MDEDARYTPEGKRRNLVPWERVLKGDMDYGQDHAGYISHAQVRACLLIDELYNRKIIGPSHHFYGIQILTMRKLFLSPVAFKHGMFIIKRDEEAAPDKPIPMEDTDYLRVLRGIKDIDHRNLVREICDEAADPQLYHRYVSHKVALAFDALCEAVSALWDEKNARQNAGHVADC